MSEKKQTLQTADRALCLIELLGNCGKQMSAQEISKELGTSRTATYALLNSLQQKNFIEKDSRTKKYFIGYRMLELGARYRYQHYFVPACERGIYTLVRKWKFQINLSIYKDPAICVFLYVKTPEEYSHATPHTVMPAYATGGGKLLLANLPDEQLRDTLERIELRPYAKATITDKQQLLRELEEIRMQGYSTEREENYKGRGCIACPIYDSEGAVLAALSMVIPIEQMDEKFDLILEDLKNVCYDISQELGYNPFIAGYNS